MLEEKYFKQYKALKVEIRRLENRLRALPKGMVTDYANDYSTGFPRQIKLEGQADPNPGDRLRYLIKDRKEKAESLLISIEEEISKIEDSTTRVVLSHYYCDGDSFRQIAEDLGYIQEKSARDIKEKYFNPDTKNTENTKK